MLQVPALPVVVERKRATTQLNVLCSVGSFKEMLYMPACDCRHCLLRWALSVDVIAVVLS